MTWRAIADARAGRGAPAAGDRVAAAKRKLFPNWPSGAATIACALFLAWAAPGLIRFFFIDAVWLARDGAPCRAPGAGACWAFVGAKIAYFRYGSYPIDQRWRVDLTMMIGAVLVARLLWRDARGTARAGALYIFGVAAGAFLLSPGPEALVDRPSEALILAGGVALAAALWFWRRGKRAAAIAFFLIYPFAAYVLLRGAPPLGLSFVSTSLWGGVFVTLLVALAGIVGALPIGVLLALGRRSRLPVVRFCAIAFIELARGVPLITVLFLANTMLPLFVPSNLTPDRFLRPLVAVALFAGAYMAEVVRAGLQSVARGQYEAALSLGLGRWRTMRLIILPQALGAVVPAIVSSFISLFKDTTLIAAVGVFDFLRTVDSARIDPSWSGPTITTTAYAFAALFYWVFCFGMSRYSLAIERDLRKGKHGA